MIKALRIQNFRQFKCVDISFDDTQSKIIYFGGNSGVGKTTLFNAIQWGIDRCSVGLLDVNNIINAEELVNAPVDTILKVVVEIEIEFEGEQYKSIKCLEGKKTLKNNFRVINTTFNVFQKISTDWLFLNADRLLPENYIDYMFFGVRELDNKGFMNMLIAQISNLSRTLENASKICRRAKSELLKCCVSPQSQKRLEERLPKIETNNKECSDRVEVLCKELDSEKKRLDELKSIIAFQRGITESDLPNALKYELNARTTRVNYLDEEKGRYQKRLAHFEQEYKEIKKLLKRANAENEKYLGMITYIEELQKWLNQDLYDKNIQIREMLNVCFEKEVAKTGLFTAEQWKVEDLEKLQDVETWQKKALWICFFFACRECIHTETERKITDIPLVIDSFFSSFGMYEMEKMAKYLAKRNEQIIIIDSEKLLAHDDINKYIGIMYEITANKECWVSSLVRVE